MLQFSFGDWGDYEINYRRGKIDVPWENVDFSANAYYLQIVHTQNGTPMSKLHVLLLFFHICWELHNIFAVIASSLEFSYISLKKANLSIWKQD